MLPRDVSLKTQLNKVITLNIPLISAAMDTVTEARLAISIAQEGGLGILHKNMTIADQAAEVRKVKKFESGVVRDPVTISPNATIRELIAITQAQKISGVPVVENDLLVGIVTGRDLRFEDRFDALVSSIMTPKDRLVTAKEGTPLEKVKGLLHKHRM